MHRPCVRTPLSPPPPPPPPSPPPPPRLNSGAESAVWPRMSSAWSRLSHPYRPVARQHFSRSLSGSHHRGSRRRPSTQLREGKAAVIPAAAAAAAAALHYYEEAGRVWSRLKRLLDFSKKSCGSATGPLLFTNNVPPCLSAAAGSLA
ncbi:hypothetical protein JOB18_044914 [Solea senegalensis]|uniref:Uncharacterized protein n=1 Tax=Solea senegalensis TaxID=28829 RepID=A0AAV6Q4B5_SOLSE|nr:hypothetical protein JOB18_044914 [Solea senegalensis]